MEDKIITIATRTYSRAELLKARLESEGIECFLQNVNLIQGSVADGVNVRIKQSDVERALQILIDVQNEMGIDTLIQSPSIPHIKRILVPVDFSENSLNACDYALGFAEKLGAEIKLYHVYYNPAQNAEPFNENYIFQVKIDGHLRNIEKEAKQNLKELRNKLREKADSKGITNIKITHTLGCGTPEHEIISYSKEYKPGLIIVGTKGKGERINDIIGSVTQKVIRNAEVPVLSIPEESVFKGMDSITNILYATDFDDSDPKSLRKLMSIVAPFNMKIFCVHFESEKTSNWDKFYIEKLRKLVSKAYSDFNVECKLVESIDIITGLDEFIEKENIGLVSLTTHKRNIFQRILQPSMAKKLLIHTHRPLLVFHT